VKPFMVDKTLEYIGYLKLLEVIKSYASTTYSSDRIADLRPMADQQEIEKSLDHMEGVLDIVKWHGPIPLKDIPDIRDTLRQLSLEEFDLEATGLIAIAGFLSSCRGVVSFLRKSPNKDAYIESIIEGMRPVPEVASRIRKTINDEGFVEDSASYELSKIRSDLYQLKERVKRTLDRMMERDEVRPVLQDSYIAIRNGRYVIPLKPNYNQFFQGIVHDYSHSLKTSFVEPIEIMEMNNTMSVLDKEEKEEERRVLRELTRAVRQYATDIATNLSLIADLDFYHSLASFASTFNCVRPILETGGAIEIRGAMNPFIAISKGERAVPIDIVIGGEKKATIISGPNADGKTVALKTTGLLLLMASAGLFIPAKETPHLPVFPGLFAVMGDEQDISMELSTFTAHIEAIRNLYEQSRGGELILIDEIGGGTEPQEASALSMAIIDAFVEKGCRVIVTTHLNLLKAYGSTRPFALNVATDFDSRTMQPLYQLVYGIAGVSNALKVAEKSGMPASIIEKGYSYLGKQEYILNELLKGLEKERKEAEEEKRRAASYREETRKRLEAVKERRDEYLKETEDRCRKKVTELEIELDEIRKELARKDRESLRVAKEKASKVQRRFASEKKIIPVELHQGDYVRVATIGKEGQITGIDESKGIVDVAMGNMRMRVGKEQIEKVPRKTGKREEHVQVHEDEIEIPEISVRGMRVDEALEEVDRFVDRAIVHGNSQLKIVHGIGTGRLMTAIRSHLSEARHVKDVKRDEKNSGVTIIELA
jgi:DNA mismatch repair protein MutS2